MKKKLATSYQEYIGIYRENPNRSEIARINVSTN